MSLAKRKNEREKTRWTTQGNDRWMKDKTQLTECIHAHMVLFAFGLVDGRKCIASSRVCTWTADRWFGTMHDLVLGWEHAVNCTAWQEIRKFRIWGVLPAVLIKLLRRKRSWPRSHGPAAWIRLELVHVCRQWSHQTFLALWTFDRLMLELICRNKRKEFRICNRLWSIRVV